MRIRHQQRSDRQRVSRMRKAARSRARSRAYNTRQSRLPRDAWPARSAPSPPHRPEARAHKRSRAPRRANAPTRIGALDAEPAERLVDERRLPRRRGIVAPPDRLLQPRPGRSIRMTRQRLRERLARARAACLRDCRWRHEGERQRRFVRGLVAQFDDMQGAAACDLDKSPAPDGCERSITACADRGDRGEQHERDDDGNGQAEHPGCNSRTRSRYARAADERFQRPQKRQASGYQMSRPSTFSVSVLIRSGTRGRRGWIASALR